MKIQQVYVSVTQVENIYPCSFTQLNKPARPVQQAYLTQIKSSSKEFVGLSSLTFKSVAVLSTCLRSCALSPSMLRLRIVTESLSPLDTSPTWHRARWPSTPQSPVSINFIWKINIFSLNFTICICWLTLATNLLYTWPSTIRTCSTFRRVVTCPGLHCAVSSSVDPPCTPATIKS